MPRDFEDQKSTIIDFVTNSLRSSFSMRSSHTNRANNSSNIFNQESEYTLIITFHVTKTSIYLLINNQQLKSPPLNYFTSINSI